MSFSCRCVMWVVRMDTAGSVSWRMRRWLFAMRLLCRDCGRGQKRRLPVDDIFSVRYAERSSGLATGDFNQAEFLTANISCSRCFVGGRKKEEAGRTLVAVNPAYTSQDCSQCGHRQRKSLFVRRHLCSCCGLDIDRDENAACNILRLGLQSQPSWQKAVCFKLTEQSRRGI